MKKSLLERFIGKKILIFLDSGFRYEGHIEELDDELIVFRDKFGKDVIIKFENISEVIEK